MQHMCIFGIRRVQYVLIDFDTKKAIVGQQERPSCDQVIALRNAQVFFVQTLLGK